MQLLLIYWPLFHVNFLSYLVNSLLSKWYVPLNKGNVLDSLLVCVWWVKVALFLLLNIDTLILKSVDMDIYLLTCSCWGSQICYIHIFILLPCLVVYSLISWTSCPRQKAMLVSREQALAKSVPAATIQLLSESRNNIWRIDFVFNSNFYVVGVKEAPSAPCVGSLSVSKIQQGL